MRLFILTLPATVALLTACNPTGEVRLLESTQTLQTSIHLASEPPVKLPQEESLCPKVSPFEEGHSQSRWFRGGCLENFLYFVRGDGLTPPEKVHGEASGNHYELGMRSVTLKPKGIDERPSGAKVPLYEVLVETADGPINPCAARFQSPGARGKYDEHAVAVPGAWNVNSGEYFEKTAGGQQVFTLSCRTGAAAKCLEWGYLPWSKHEGRSLATIFRTCVAAARAQYNWGSSAAYTCEGKVIDVTDRLGIQAPGANAATLPLEAAWSERGLSCIGQPRYAACDREPSVREAPPCDEERLKDVSRWPADVLLVTRSQRDGISKDGKCPNQDRSCP